MFNKGYYDDRNLGQLDPAEDNGDAAILKRYNRIKGGVDVMLRGPLLSFGLTHSARIFPALTNFQFKFVKNSQNFLITKTAATAGTFQVFLKDFYLKIKR